MRKFNKALYGYDPKEVNSFLDSVIVQVEKIINDSKKKDASIIERDKVILELQNTVNRYKSMESTLNSSLLSAQENNERIRQMTKQESETIIGESRRNANRIISDALTRAERVQYDAELLKKNITLFKRRVKTMLEQQLQLVDDMDTNDYKINDRDDIL
jgi:cell division initiation protein